MRAVSTADATTLLAALSSSRRLFEGQRISRRAPEQQQPHSLW